MIKFRNRGKKAKIRKRMAITSNSKDRGMALTGREDQHDREGTVKKKKKKGVSPSQTFTRPCVHGFT